MKPNMLTCGRIELRANTFASVTKDGDLYMTPDDYHNFINSIRKDLDPQLSRNDELCSQASAILNKYMESELNWPKNKKIAQSKRKSK